MAELRNPYFKQPSWGSDEVSGYGDSSTYLDEGQPNSAGMDYGGAYNGATAGYSAGQAFGNPKSSFEMDNGGVWAGTASGAASGAAAGGPVGGFIGAIVGGATAVGKQDKALRKATDNVNTSFNATYDGYGRPVYNSQGFAQGQQDFQDIMKASQPGRNAMLPKRRRQMMRKSEDLYYNMQAGQQNYNKSELDFRNQSMAQNDYRKRMNNNQYYNLYRFS